jgi:hypothetical protein
MKRFILIFISLAITFGMLAQSEQLRKFAPNHKNLFSKPLERGTDTWQNVNNNAQQTELKKTTVLKMRLDSLVGLDERELFFYNAQNQAIDVQSYKWDVTQWYPRWRYEYTYQNNLVFEEISSEWDNSQWRLDWKTENHYVTNGRIDYELAYRMDSATSTWQLEYKTEYSYNAQNLVDEIVEFFWDYGAWNKSHRSVMAYNADNTISQETNDFWTGSAWEPSSMMSYDYTSNGLLDEVNYYYWQYNYWFNAMRFSYTYNANNKLTAEVMYSWNGGTSSFEPNEKMEYDYNTYGDAKTFIRSNWTGTGWEYGEKEERTFGTQWAFSDLILPPIFEDIDFQQYFTHKLNTLEFFEFMNNAWVSEDLYDLYYSTVQYVGLDEDVAPATNLYPNPVTEWLIIDIEPALENGVLNLYTTSGTLVKKVSIEASTKIYVGNLPAGMYVWQYTSGDVVNTGKLIKQ